VQDYGREKMLPLLRGRYHDAWQQRLSDTPWIELRFTEVSNSVQQIASFLSPGTKQTERPLAQGTSILQIYDKAKKELLILGEPGAGKSMLLLDLANQLVDRATIDSNHHLPIILNLSSWATKRLPLQDWLVEQLTEHYQVPQRIGKQWVEADVIFPLLDGLDEMDESARPVCIAAINKYHQKHLHTPLVVCSRQTEYKTAAAQERLTLQNAVVVQPLTKEQVDTSLSQAGQPLAALHRTLKQNQALEQLARTPLMLSTMMRTYQGTTVQTLPRQAIAGTTEQQIWHDYIEHMADQKKHKKRYSLEKTSEWLGWLARQTRARGQTIFYIENLQSDWLTSKRRLSIYEWLAIRIPGMLIGIIISLVIFIVVGGITIAESHPSDFVENILVGALLGGIFSGRTIPPRWGKNAGQPQKRSFWSRIPSWFFIGIFIGLVVGFSSDISDGSSHASLIGLDDGLNVGASCMLLCIILTRWNIFSPASSSSQKRVNFFKRIDVRDGIIAGFLLALSLGLNTVLSIELSLDTNTEVQQGSIPPGTGLSWALAFGVAILLSEYMTFGFIGGFTSRLLTRQTREIHSTDRVKWSWRSLWEGLFSKQHLLTALNFWLFYIILSMVTVSSAIIIAMLPLMGDMAQISGAFLWIWVVILLAMGLIIGVIVGLIIGLTFGLGNMLSFWVLLGVAQGISSKKIDDRYRTIPNQGIRNSASYGLAVGGFAFILGGLTGWANGVVSYVWGKFTDTRQLTDNASSDVLGKWLSNSWNAGISGGWGAAWLNGIIIGISVGLLAALFYGWLAFLRHYTLRFLLWQAKSLPWNIPRFLDEAASCHLLHKVGGGYEFRHRSLLDYFADGEDKPGTSPDETTPSTHLPVFVSSTNAEPSLYSSIADLKTGPLTPATPTLAASQEAQQLLPCGHLCRVNARFCSVCGRPVVSPSLPVTPVSIPLSPVLPLPITPSPVPMPSRLSFKQRATRWSLVISVCLLEIFLTYGIIHTNPAVSSDIFVQHATPGTIQGDYTIIDNTLTNGNPNAIVMVTQNWNPGGGDGVYNNHPVGVWYDGAYWAIFNEDGADMKPQASFNVAVLSKSSSVFVQVTTPKNITDASTLIDNPLTNGNSHAIVMVTQNGNRGSGAYNNHPVGVQYTSSGKWAICNEDHAPMMPHLFFNVQILKPSSSAFVHQATYSNAGYGYTVFNNDATNGHANAIVLVTQNLNPAGNDKIYNEHEVEVLYTEGKWSVLNEGYSRMPLQASFNIEILQLRSDTTSFRDNEIYYRQ
jgi:hypothetical protein